jgi:hypothetical protein
MRRRTIGPVPTIGGRFPAEPITVCFGEHLSISAAARLSANAVNHL